MLVRGLTVPSRGDKVKQNMKEMEKMTRVSSEIEINVSKEEIWNILADLGSVGLWNPGVTKAHYISEAKHGVGAARHCDLPDGGYVKERATEWTPGESFTLEITEGTIPFSSAFGTVALKGDQRKSVVSYTLRYELQPSAPIDPAEFEQQWREEFLPGVLAALKHYAETGKPMPMP